MGPDRKLIVHHALADTSDAAKRRTKTAGLGTASMVQMTRVFRKNIIMINDETIQTRCHKYR